jgi:hypothetical protein
MIKEIIKKKFVSLHKTSFILAILCFSCNQSQVTNVKQFANYVSIAPEIDGKMDTCWLNADIIKLCNYNLGIENVKDSNDLSASYRIIWDTLQLYLLIDVTDEKKFDIQKINFPIDIPEGYNCDCIELHFDAENRKINELGSFDIEKGDSRYEFVYSRDKITGTFLSKKNIAFAQSDTPKGYMFEIAIPFETLSMVSKPGYTFGFEISVYDNDYDPNLKFYNYDNRSAISWSQKQDAEAWRNIGLYGNITLKRNY